MNALCDDLQACVANHDTTEFLRTYLGHMTSGHNLAVPAYLTLEKIKEGWDAILPQHRLACSDEFVWQLSAEWLTLVKKQGGRMAPDFAAQCLAILDSKPAPAGASLKPSKSPSENDPVFNKADYTTAISTQLAEFADADDEMGFLRYYMECTQNGFWLPMPNRRELKNVRACWMVIFRRMNIACKHDFLAHLCQLWIKMIKEQGGEITHQFAAECLAALSKIKPDHTIDPRLIPAAPKHLPDTSLEVSAQGAVSTHISTDYYDRDPEDDSQAASRIEADPRLLRKMPHMFETGDIDGFLYIHLRQVFAAADSGTDSPRIPMTTLLTRIKKEWTAIITRDYNRSADAQFLKELTARWFFLMNTHGLPHSRIQRNKLLDIVSQAYAQSRTNPSSKPGKAPIWHRLLSMFSRA